MELHLSTLDYVIIAVYLGFSVALSLFFHGKQKTTRDYFFGGGRMRWWAMAISLFATLFSAISFVAAPGEGYNFGMTMALNNFLLILPLPIGLYIFLRFFYELRVRTCNEYLEWRFGPVLRLVSSLGFMLLRGVYLGVVLYASALVLQRAIGFPLAVSITIVGLFGLILAYTGGMTSVVWTDVAQSVILIGSILIALGIILASVPGGFGGVMKVASENHRLFNVSKESGFWSFDPQVRISFWWWAIQLPLLVFTYATDQMQLQRALASGNFKSIGKTVWGYNLASVPIMFLFYFVGVAIFAYFRTVGAETLPQDLNGDGAFNYFISTILPVGIRGLVVSGILAAVISTVDSVLNSLSTVFIHDIYTPWFARNRSQEHYLKAARISTLVFGLLTLVIGLLIVKVFHNGTFPLIEVSNLCLGLFGAFTGGFFVLGMLSRRSNSKGVLTGMAMAIAFGCYITYFHYLRKPADERLSFIFIGLGTNIVAIVGGLLASYLFKAPSPEQQQLVVWGMFRRIKEGTLPRFVKDEE